MTLPTVGDNRKKQETVQERATTSTESNWMGVGVSSCSGYGKVSTERFIDEFRRTAQFNITRFGRGL